LKSGMTTERVFLLISTRERRANRPHHGVLLCVRELGVEGKGEEPVGRSLRDGERTTSQAEPCVGFLKMNGDWIVDRTRDAHTLDRLEDRGARRGLDGVEVVDRRAVGSFGRKLQIAHTAEKRGVASGDVAARLVPSLEMGELH